MKGRSRKRKNIQAPKLTLKFQFRFTDSFHYFAQDHLILNRISVPLWSSMYETIKSCLTVKGFYENLVGACKEQYIQIIL